MVLGMAPSQSGAFMRAFGGVQAPSREGTPVRAFVIASLTKRAGENMGVSRSVIHKNLDGGIERFMPARFRAYHMILSFDYWRCVSWPT